MPHQTKTAYLIKVCEVVEGLIEEGYVSITFQDILDVLNDGRDMDTIGPSERAAQRHDLNDALGRKVRIMLEGRNFSIRVVPMGLRYLRSFKKTKQGPDKLDIDNWLQKEWAASGAMSQNVPWDEFVYLRLNSCCAGARKAVAIRIVRQQTEDYFFFAYERRRSGTSHRNDKKVSDDFVASIEKGLMTQEQAQAIRDGGSVFPFRPRQVV